MGTKSFDIILQGSGTVLLSLKDQINPDEAGEVMRRAEAHLASRRPITLINGVDQIIDNRPMNERSPTRITTVDRSSGKYHERWIEVQLDGNERVLVDERCQTDQSGRYDVLPEGPPESADVNTLCRWCYPAVKHG